MPPSKLQQDIVQETYSCFRRSPCISQFIQEWSEALKQWELQVHAQWLDAHETVSGDYHWHFQSLDKTLIVSFDKDFFDSLSSCLNFIMSQYDQGSASWSILDNLDFCVLLWNIPLGVPGYANPAALSVVHDNALGELASMLESSSQQSLGISFSDWLNKSVCSKVERTNFVLYDGLQPFCRFSMIIKELAHGHVLLSWSDYQFLSDLSFQEMNASSNSEDYLDVINGVLKELNGVQGANVVFMLVDMHSSGIPEDHMREYMGIAYQRISALVEHHDKVSIISDKEILIILEDAQDNYVQSVFSRCTQSLQDPFLYYQSGEMSTLKPLPSAISALRVFSDSFLSSLGIITSLRALIMEGNHDRLNIKVEIDAHEIQTPFFKEHTVLVHYQPILNLKTGKIEGVEALARLKKGNIILSPDKFIKDMTYADKKILTLEVMHIAKKDILESSHCDLLVSVNLDLSTVHQDLLNVISSSSSQLGGRLVLELLEGNDPVKIPALKQHMSFLNEFGFRFALDDVGSAYSSLSRIKDLPVHKVKLDQEFIRSIPEHPRNLIFTKIVSDLSRWLNLELIVEGVETEGILEAVEVLGVQHIQGFYISKPLPAEDLFKFIDSFRLPKKACPSTLLGLYALQMLRHDGVVLGMLDKSFFQVPSRSLLEACFQHLRAVDNVAADVLKKATDEYDATIQKLGHTSVDILSQAFDAWESQWLSVYTP